MLAVAALWAAPAVSCRLALALALDVSGSVDTPEYRLQIGGLAGALRDPEVQAVLLSAPENPVALSVFEWSGRTDQRILVGWTDIVSPESLDGIIAQLAATQRAFMSPSTGLGTAMQRGATLLRQRPDCARHVLDISGDGKNNDGPRPRAVRDSAPLQGITVNGLVIGLEFSKPVERRHVGLSELAAYYRANVLRGPDAFLQVAVGFEDYQNAMTKKLLRELQSFAMSQPGEGPSFIGKEGSRPSTAN